MLGVEAVAVEASFVMGSGLVSLLLVAATPATALVVLAGVTATGALGVAAGAGAGAGAPLPGRADALGPMRSPGTRTLLAATGAFGIADGITQLAVVGATGRHLAGVLLAAVAAASFGGGLVYVRWRRVDSALDFCTAHFAMAVALVLAAGASPSNLGLAGALVVQGLVGSPVPIDNSRRRACGPDGGGGAGRRRSDRIRPPGVVAVAHHAGQVASADAGIPGRAEGSQSNHSAPVPSSASYRYR